MIIVSFRRRTPRYAIDIVLHLLSSHSPGYQVRPHVVKGRMPHPRKDEWHALLVPETGEQRRAIHQGELRLFPFWMRVELPCVVLVYDGAECCEEEDRAEESEEGEGKGFLFGDGAGHDGERSMAMKSKGRGIAGGERRRESSSLYHSRFRQRRRLQT